MDYKMTDHTMPGGAPFGRLTASSQSVLASKQRSFERANALLVAFFVVLTLAITAGAWMAFSQY